MTCFLSRPLPGLLGGPGRPSFQRGAGQQSVVESRPLHSLSLGTLFIVGHKASRLHCGIKEAKRVATIFVPV